MSVRVHYLCAFGNNLFQYFAARLFAEHHGFDLTSDFVPLVTPHNTQEDHGQHILSMTPPEPGRRFEGQETMIHDRTERDLFDTGWEPGAYVFRGLFQRTRWFLDRRDKVRSFAMLDPVEPAHKDDLVVNLRIAPDYRGPGFLLHPRWYTSILDQTSFRKLHIVADHLDRDYIKHFAKYDPIVLHRGSKGDFDYLRSFRRIVCANSTFSWWAAFFSDAEEIITHARWFTDEALRRLGLDRKIIDFQAFPAGVGTLVDGPFYCEV